MTASHSDRFARRALQVGRSRRCDSMEARPSLWRSPIDCFSPEGFAMTGDCFASLAMTGDCFASLAMTAAGHDYTGQRGSLTKPAASAVPVKIMTAHKITHVVMTSFKKTMPMMLANKGIKYVTVMVRDAPTLAIKRKYST